MLPGPLQVGDLLAGRYRLLDPVATDGPTVLWRAQDEVLARDVAVRVLPTPDRVSKAEVGPFLRAAARAGKVTHSGLVRVYDAALEPGPRRSADVAFLIREWVEGEPLDEHLLRVGELAVPDAADLLRQLADALTAAHGAGLAHGRIHPGNVLITPAGRVRVTDAAVAAAVHGEPVVALSETAVRADTRDAGAVLYALLTTHWPAGSTPQPRGQLPASPLSHGRALGPHQVRAAVPRQLDHVVLRALDPAQVPTLTPLRTPAALADAADACAEEARHARQAAQAAREPGWVRRHLGWVVGSALVLLFATVGWFSGLAIGELDRQPDAVDVLEASPTPTAPGASPAARISLQGLVIRDFDPLGDGQENPDQVPNATDPDPTTAWVTQRYRTSGFSGLKPGVGLLVDLGRVRDVHRVQVAFTAAGAHAQLRVADTAPQSLGDTRVVDADESGHQLVALSPAAPTRARFLLVWLTELPKDTDGGYRVGIADLSAG